jgi:ATP-dependent RNA helicase DeaD
MTDSDPMHAVRAELRVALDRRGFTELTAVQLAVLDASTEDRNIRLSSQTGSGKTVAIGLALGPDLIDNAERDKKREGPVALFITPTRELAQQVHDELKWLFAELPRFRTAVVTGGTDIGRERRNLKPPPHLLVATPGRLLDHMRAGKVSFASLRHVALDEADRMLDMGFADELEQIIEALPAERRSHLVSATFPRAVRRLADAFQDDALTIEGTKLGATHEDIEHVAHVVSSRDHYAAIVNTLLLLDGAKCLVFVQRREDTTALSERLAGDGFSAMPISGDLSQSQRTRALNAFRNGLIRTLVATDVAARGIDVADVAAVIHADLPRDPNDYVHRSGRTGRAGRQGTSIALVTPAQRRFAQRLFDSARVDVSWEELPTAKSIEKTLKKRWRKQLHDRIAGDEPPSEVHQRYAAHLLESHPAEKLVAVLLDLAEPELPRRAMDIAPAPKRPPRDDRPGRSRPAGKGPGRKKTGKQPAKKRPAKKRPSTGGKRPAKKRKAPPK